MGRGFLVAISVLDVLLFVWAFFVEDQAVAVFMALASGIACMINWDSWQCLTVLQDRLHHLKRGQAGAWPVGVRCASNADTCLAPRHRGARRHCSDPSVGAHAQLHTRARPGV